MQTSSQRAYIIQKLLIFIAAFLLWYFAAFYFIRGIAAAEAPMPEPVAMMPKPLTVEEIIVKKAGEYGLDPDRALRIARCESGLNPKARNPNSSASGVFQFISSTWASVNRIRGIQADVLDAEANVDNAMWLAKNEGWQHWVCR